MRAAMWLVAAAATAALGCDFGLGGGGGGCAKISQDDYELPVKRVIGASVAARVTQSGITFLTDRIKTLILSFFDADADGRAIVPLSTLGLGEITTSLGPFDASVRDLVITLDLSRLAVRLVPGSSPARIEITIEDADIGLVEGVVAGGIDGTFFSGDAACGLANGGNGRVALLSMTLVLQLQTDPDGSLQVKVLPSQFDLQQIGLSLETDCNIRECLDGLSPGNTGECLECETICPVVDLGAELASLLQDSLDGLIDQLLDLLADDLANLFLDGVLNGRPLAIEGELPLADVLGPILGWMRTARPLGVLARPAGEAFRVTGAGPTLGLDLVFDAGLDASPPHPCVAPVGTDRIWEAGPRPSFDGLATDASGVEVPYDVGVGVSSAVINEAIWALWKSGALCIDASTDDIVTLTNGKLLVTAGTLDLLLPGIAEIAGADAPVRFTVRPRLSENAQAGDVVTVGGDPLLVIDIADATIAVEALVGDAWLRMVSFRAGLALKVGLKATSDAKIQISVADVALTDLSLPDNEIFQSARLDVVAPFIVELALGFLADRPLTLDLGLSGLGTSLGLPLVPVVIGMGPAGVNHDWLAVYVRLEDPPAPRAAEAPATEAPQPITSMYERGSRAARRAGEVDIPPQDPDDGGCAGGGGGPAGGVVLALLLVCGRRRAWRARVLPVFGLAAGASCSDAGDAPGQRCIGHDQCDDGFLCGPEGLCVGATACDGDGDCCPGAVCFSGWCRPTATCGPGRPCLGLGDVCEGDQCVPAPCDSASGCGEPFACVAGRCLAGAPCDGRCGAGEVCDVASGRCRETACATGCALGWPIVASALADPLTCGEPACACGMALDVPRGRPGVDGVLRASGEGAGLVSYDPAYGDLVLSTFSSEGLRTDLVLDGAPADVEPVAVAGSYRGGVLAPGPDRGRHPALVTDGSAWEVVYRDEDTQRLRYRRFDATTGQALAPGLPGELPIGGDVGRYTCLVRQGATLSGLAFVSADPGDQVSRLVRFEGVAGGWQVSTVLETPLPLRATNPCAGACGFGEACVVDGQTEACGDALQLSGCPTPCGAHEVCAAVGEAPAACHARVYTRYDADRLPFGEGLFVSCDADVAAWYDADRRRLVVARAPFQPGDRQVVDAGVDRDPGHHVAITRLSSGDVALVHQDLVAGRLRAGVAADVLGAWSFVDVDAGGAWADIIEAEGRVVVVHGEPEAGDIRVAARALAAGSCWSTAAVLEDGGFAYPSVAPAASGGLWVSALGYAFEADLDPAHRPVITHIATPLGCGR